jgi:nucleotide-binding universal stress UspA family protein
MAARARRIVVGYDGSDVSRRALDAAADLVGYGATLTVVGVRANGTFDTTAAVDRAREHLLHRHISALYTEPPGEPTEAIANAAATLQADLVVVGVTDGAAPDGELGPVAAGVLREAHCDVLVVR